MKTIKVKLTKLVSVNLPTIPNFIIHEHGKLREVVPVNMFDKKELRKIAKVWSQELIKRGAK